MPRLINIKEYTFGWNTYKIDFESIQHIILKVPVIKLTANFEPKTMKAKWQLIYSLKVQEGNGCKTVILSPTTISLNMS